MKISTFLHFILVETQIFKVKILNLLIFPAEGDWEAHWEGSQLVDDVANDIQNGEGEKRIVVKEIYTEIKIHGLKM